MIEDVGASADADRASRASPQAPTGLGHAATIPCASTWEMGIWIRAAVAEAFGTQALEAIDKRGSGKAYRLIPNPGWDFVGEYVLKAMKRG